MAVADGDPAVIVSPVEVRAADQEPAAAPVLPLPPSGDESPGGDERARGDLWPTGGGPPAVVRYRRVVLDRGDLQLVADLHPTLTVLLARPEHVEPATDLLAGALRTAEAGVHLELVDGAGRELLLFRPHGDRSRVLDLADQRETSVSLGPALLGRTSEAIPASDPPSGVPAVGAVTPSSTAGSVTPSPAAEVDPPSEVPAVGTVMPSFTAGSVTPSSGVDVVTRLSAVDQVELWRTADRLTALDQPARRTADGSTRPSPSRNPLRRLALRRTARPPLAPPRPGERAEVAERWRSLAGGVPVTQALALRRAIEAGAGVRRHSAALTAAVSGADGALRSEEAVDRVVAVIGGMLVRSPTLPHVLALPGPEGTHVELPLLLDLLPGVLAGHQLIVVTSSPDVADWARLESHADRAALVGAGG